MYKSLSVLKRAMRLVYNVVCQKTQKCPFHVTDRARCPSRRLIRPIGAKFRWNYIPSSDFVYNFPASVRRGQVKAKPDSDHQDGQLQESEGTEDEEIQEEGTAMATTSVDDTIGNANDDKSDDKNEKKDSESIFSSFGSMFSFESLQSRIQQRKAEFGILMSLIVSYPAVRGTIAVLLGWYVHIQPLGSLHWDMNDALYGLIFAAFPIILMDALIMVPSWEPERTTRQMRMMLPKFIAERLTEIDPTAFIVENKYPKSTQAFDTESKQARDLPSTDNSISLDIVSRTPSILRIDSDSELETQRLYDNGSNNAEEIDVSDEGSSETTLQDASESVDERAESHNFLSASSAETENQASDQKTKTMEAASSQLSDEDAPLVEIEREVSVRKDQHPFKAAMYRTQSERVLNNPGNYLSLASEGILLLLVHTSEEMLYRGVILTLSVQWLTDRLYEAGVEESMRLGFLDIELAVPQIGAVLAAVGMTALATAFLVQQELFPLKLLDKTSSNLKEKKDDSEENGTDSDLSIEQRQKELRKRYGAMLPSERDAMNSEKDETSTLNTDREMNKENGIYKSENSATGAEQRITEVLDQVRDSVASQQLWRAAILGIDELIQWSTLSSVFLVTGNILSPLVGSIAADIFYSILQRQRGRVLREAMLGRSKENNRQRSALLEAIRDYQKFKSSRFEPEQSNHDVKQERESEDSQSCVENEENMKEKEGDDRSE